MKPEILARRQRTAEVEHENPASQKINSQNAESPPHGV
jgi:hypothetical protein